MRLDFLILADAAEVGDRGKVSILGGAITRVTPPELPFRLPHVCAVVRLAADAEDRGVTHEASFRWLSPGGQQIGPTLRNEFTISGEETLGGEEHGVMVVVEMVMLPLTEEGPHRFQFLLDGEVLAVRQIAVAVADQGEPPE